MSFFPVSDCYAPQKLRCQRLRRVSVPDGFYPSDALENDAPCDIIRICCNVVSISRICSWERFCADWVLPVLLVATCLYIPVRRACWRLVLQLLLHLSCPSAFPPSFFRYTLLIRMFQALEVDMVKMLSALWVNVAKPFPLLYAIIIASASGL